MIVLPNQRQQRRRIVIVGPIPATHLKVNGVAPIRAKTPLRFQVGGLIVVAEEDGVFLYYCPIEKHCIVRGRATSVHPPELGANYVLNRPDFPGGSNF